MSPPRTRVVEHRPALRWLWLALPLAALLLALAAMPRAEAQGPQMPPAKVKTVKAETRLLAPQVEVPGTVLSRNDARISAEVSGRIVWIGEVGDILKKGEIIARLDDKSYQAEVKRLEAEFTAKSNQLKRVEELAAAQFSSQSSLDQAISDRDAAEAQLVQGQHNLERTQIRAPFSGIIAERPGQLGEVVAPGTQVARLVDTQNLEISARVPISSSPYLTGLKSVFVTDGIVGHTLPVRTVVPVGDERSRMMEIRVGMDGSGWVVGTAVKVEVPSGAAKEVVAVPRDALILRPGAIYVFTVDEQGNAKRYTVKVGAASGEYVEVIGDVAPGASVVVRGGERLNEGQQVAEVADNL
jgi:RND family efflux transporter MFP subunit